MYIFDKAKNHVLGAPEWRVNPNIIYLREMELVYVKFGGTTENSMFEDLIILILTEGVYLGGVSIIAGGVPSQVAFSSPGLVKVASREPV